MPYPKRVGPPLYTLPTGATIPHGGTAFELLLQEAGVKLEDAHKSPAIRQWIQRNYRQKWVPSKVLEAVGIRPEDAV